MIQPSVREEAKRFIPTIASANDVYKLFHLLKYPKDKLFDSSYKRDIGEFEFKKEEREKIRAIYTVFSYDKDLPVFLMETSTTSHPFLKYVKGPRGSLPPLPPDCDVQLREHNIRPSRL